MQKKRLNIAVSGLNANDNPGPGLSVIRAIRESEDFDGIITGLSYDPLDPGIYMKGICDNAFLMPYPSAGAENLLERIREIHVMTSLDVIVPCLDSELHAYVKISHGKPISDVTAISQLDKEFRFPLMVKGQFYEAHLTYSSMEAEDCFRKLSAKWGLPVVVQEFIVGEEYDVVALGDGQGGLVGAVPMKKMQLTDKGKAWGGITIDDATMNNFVRDIISKLKWRGPCEIEIIKSKDEGNFYLIELNPRFPAWCYLAVGAGQNLPWATVKLALAEPVEELAPCKVGTMFLRNSVDQIYPLSEYQEITTAGVLRRVVSNK
jgi:carbamoyl-phosphate synthase large subunit